MNKRNGIRALYSIRQKLVIRKKNADELIALNITADNLRARYRTERGVPFVGVYLRNINPYLYSEIQGSKKKHRSIKLQSHLDSNLEPVMYPLLKLNISTAGGTWEYEFTFQIWVLLIFIFCYFNSLLFHAMPNVQLHILF